MTNLIIIKVGDNFQENNNNINNTVPEEESETDILDQYISDSVTNKTSTHEPSADIPTELVKRPSLSRSLRREQQHLQLELSTSKEKVKVEEDQLTLQTPSKIGKEDSSNQTAPQEEIHVNLQLDISKVQFQDDKEELERVKSNKSSLHRSKSLLSRTTSTVKKTLSPNEILTTGISEMEALKIERETLKTGLHGDESLKFFQTDKWFNSSTETNGAEYSPVTGLAKTAGYSILQNESIHNPFFKEEQITSLPIQEEKFSGKLIPKKSIIQWEKLDNNYNDVDRGKGNIIEMEKFKKSVLSKTVLLTTMLAICLAILIPLCLVYHSGTHETTMKYFDRIPRTEKMSTIYELLDKYGMSLDSQQKPQNQTSFKEVHGYDNIFYYNSFAGINPKYQKNLKIKSIMENDNLRNIFYGVNYAPQNIILPICGASFDEILLDIATLSKITTRIRLYGLHCNQLKHTLDAIMALGVNMTVSIGLWISYNDDNNDEQLLMMSDILKSYPIHLIESIIVGNEVLLRFDKSNFELNEIIAKVKQVSKNVTESVSIGTSDFARTVEFLSNSDVTGVNIYPFFSGIEVEKAKNYTFQTLRGIKKPVFISEIGWPSDGGKFQQAEASLLNLQIFVNEFLCESNKQNIGYYWFELFDEPWKKIYNEGSRQWESHWGLFDESRNLKIKLPNCV